MRNLALILATAAGLFAVAAPAQTQSCKVCAEPQKACMKNYAGPTCKSEYRMCMKSCGKT
jgi:hypothetical protein